MVHSVMNQLHLQNACFITKEKEQRMQGERCGWVFPLAEKRISQKSEEPILLREAIFISLRSDESCQLFHHHLAFSPFTLLLKHFSWSHDIARDVDYLIHLDLWARSFLVRTFLCQPGEEMNLGNPCCLDIYNLWYYDFRNHNSNKG